MHERVQDLMEQAPCFVLLKTFSNTLCALYEEQDQNTRFYNEPLEVFVSQQTPKRESVAVKGGNQTRRTI